jgi:hypothetical protein
MALALPVAIIQRSSTWLEPEPQRCPGIRTAWLWPFLLQSFNAALGWNQNSNMTQSSSLPVAIKAALGLNQNKTRCPGIRTA